MDYKNQYERATLIIPELSIGEIIEFFGIDIYEVAFQLLNEKPEEVVKDILDEIETQEKEYHLTQRKLIKYEIPHPIKARSKNEAINIGTENMNWEIIEEPETDIVAEAI